MPENNDRRVLSIFVIIVVYSLAGIVSLFPYWIVFGQVVNELGNPVEHARLIASLAFELDRSVTTDAKGNFLVRIGVFDYWDQLGLPCIVAYKPGYRRYRRCYKQWKFNPKFTRVFIKIQESDPTEDQEALKNHEKELRLSRRIGDVKGETDALNSIGDVYRHLGQYQKALENYEKSLVISRKTGDVKLEGVILKNIGAVHDHMGQHQ
jgi:tetratricopeptide (TPR) repeat protein